MPSAKQAIEIRPPSNTFSACRKPSPTSPILFPSGMRQLSKIISAVSLARIPSLFSFFPPLKPGVPFSTMKAVALPLVLGSPVRQIRTATSPVLPWVIQFFVPLITHSFESLVAVHRIFPASLPVLGSVNPQAPIHSAVANFGKYFLFCSSFAKVMI